MFDLLLHSLASYFIITTLFIFADIIGNILKVNIRITQIVLITITIGVYKEFYDHYNTSHVFNSHLIDMWGNIIGIYIGWLFIYYLHSKFELYNMNNKGE